MSEEVRDMKQKTVFELVIVRRHVFDGDLVEEIIDETTVLAEGSREAIIEAWRGLDKDIPTEEVSIEGRPFSGT